MGEKRAITLTDNQQPNKYYSFVSDIKNKIEDGHISEACKRA